ALGTPYISRVPFRSFCVFISFLAIISFAPYLRGAVTSYRWAFLTCLEFALSVVFDHVASPSILAFLSLAPYPVRFSCIGGLSSLALSSSLFSWVLFSLLHCSFLPFS
ncbi:unnamed protein product, partial [Ectocarpus fasciculatus]